MSQPVHGEFPSRVWTFLLGFGAGVLLTAIIAAAVFFVINRPEPPPPTWTGVFDDPAGDLIDSEGGQASDYQPFMDIAGAEILVGDRGILREGRSSGEISEPSEGQDGKEEGSLVVLVTINMNEPVPPPAEHDDTFVLGVALDLDGDPANNDPSTPNIRGTDTTIAITCDPRQSRCLEGIATFDGSNWTLQAKEITWDIVDDTVRMAFLLDFLPEDRDIEEVGWRVFSSTIDPVAGGAAVSDVADNDLDSLLKLSIIQ